MKKMAIHIGIDKAILYHRGRERGERDEGGPKGELV
jgi:hypothetical protein